MTDTIKMSGGNVLLKGEGVSTCCCHCCNEVDLDDLLYGWASDLPWSQPPVAIGAWNAEPPFEGAMRWPACLRFVCMCGRDNKVACYREFGGPTTNNRSLFGIVAEYLKIIGEEDGEMPVLEIDLAQWFPRKPPVGQYEPVVPQGEFYGEQKFGPWEVPLRVKGSIGVDDDLYINGQITKLDDPNVAGGVVVDLIHPPRQFLTIDVLNSPIYGGPCSAEGILSVLGPGVPNGCRIYRIEFFGWKRHATEDEPSQWQSADDACLVSHVVFGKGTAPTNLAVPLVTKNEKQFKANGGAWMGAPTALVFQWQLSDNGIDWKDIDGASKPLFTATENEEEKYIRVWVVASNRFGSSDPVYSESMVIT